jgi:tRNA A-37 threonylcarbamoyl transferase component Bud32/Leucine-rich repeat (LRR) protein
MSDTPSRPATPAPEPASRVTLPCAGPPAVWPQRVGEFVVLGKLGEGGMGAVYLAEDPKLRRRVAVKTMKPELAARPADRERFEREARAAAAVESDHIVPILHVGEAADGTPFIVMPLLRGESLDARLRRDAAVPLDLVLKVAREVAEGLAAAHKKDLIHRDIKPANIWLEADPEAGERVLRCKVLDFGLVRAADGAESQLTGTGAVVGTPAYMAPEQARGKPVDHRADLFSLGATLYRAATGRLPFDGPTPLAVVIALTTEEPTPVRELAPGLPPALADLIPRLMSKDPAKRPRSAAEVVAAVRAIEADVQARGAAYTVPVRGAPAATVPAELSPSGPRLLPSGVEETTAADLVPEPRAAPNAPRGRTRLLAAAVVGALVLAVSGAWLSGAFGEKNADRSEDAARSEPKKEPKNEEPKKEEPRKEEPKKEEPKKEEPKKDAAPDRAADRTAAEYVLSVGGVVQVNGEEHEIADANELPQEPFRLTHVYLNSNKQVTDKGSEVFKDCKNLELLYLYGTDLTDKGLAHFKDCRTLKTLYLSHNAFGDTGLAAFKNCKALVSLQLKKTKVTDTGLADFEGCKNLEALDLGETAVTDDGLAHFGGCTKLAELDLSTTRITDAGLAHFKNCKEIRSLSLFDTRTTDDGLAHFKDCAGLYSLELSKTRVTDKGLARFKDYTNLTSLGLSDTKVTDEGLALFAKSTSLTRLGLSETQIGDEGFAHFKDCKDLAELSLAGTNLSDASLGLLKQFTKLDTLDLKKTALTEKDVYELATALPSCKLKWNGGTIHPATEADRTAAEFVLAAGGSVHVNGEANDIKAKAALPKELFRLTAVFLTEKVKGADLAVFEDCKNVTDLYLVGTGIGDDGLAHFKNCKSLKELFLSGTVVSAKSVDTIKGFTKLTNLSVGVTKLTARDVSDLAKALPGCTIQHDGGTIEPKEK